MEDRNEWICPVCGEGIEMQFAACWKCAPRIEQEQPFVTPTTQRNTNLLLAIGISFVLGGFLATIFGSVLMLNNETMHKVGIMMMVAGVVITIWAVVTLIENRK